MMIELGVIRPFRFVSPKAFKNGTTKDGVNEYIGTGPYVLKQNTVDQEAIFEVNEKYWGEKPKVKIIRVKVIPDGQTRALALEKGEIDLLFGKNMIDAETMEKFSTMKDFETKMSEPLSTRMMIVNTTKGALQDKNVRKAIQHVLDKKAISESIFAGSELPADYLLAKTVKYGFNDGNDYQIKNVQTTSEHSNFDIYKNSELLGTFTMAVFGLHDISNATSAIALADLNGISVEKIQESLSQYKPAERRFSEHKIGNSVVVDDYAHHPSEIKATINSARRKYADKEVVAIFQPHTYTRTAKFLNEFAESLETADKVFLCPIFASVREKEKIVVEINETLNSVSPRNIVIKKHHLVQPKVFLPIFPGTNCEYEMQNAFLKEGAKAKIMPLVNLTPESLQESIKNWVKEIDNSQILAFSGGFSAGDEPDGSAKFIVNVLKNEMMRDAVHRFLERDGLIIGICNGFQALVKSGLLPYGEIKDLDENSPTLAHNAIGRHISQMVNVKVVNDESPWLKGMKDQVYTIPISHGEGRFMASEEVIKELYKNGQIATQYIDLEGNIAHVMPFNPNNSLFGIEGITSPCGKIFGRMGHPERFSEGLFRNIPEANYHNIFKNGVEYFK